MKLMEIKDYDAQWLIHEFSDKNWKGRRIQNFVKKEARNWFTWFLTGSDRPHVSCSCVVQHGAVADWCYSWPMASTLRSLCLSEMRTFWTYVVTISLFSVYLMNFMLHSNRCCSKSASLSVIAGTDYKIGLRLSVCVSVRLRALSRSHFLINFHKNWHRRKNPQKEEQVR